MKKFSLIACVILLAAAAVFAQRRFRGGGGFGGGGFGGESYVPEGTQTAREVPSHSTGTPNWTNAPGFEKDVFTFVRIIRERKVGVTVE